MRAKAGSNGPLSPFEGPLTPLSPAWTASQLPSGFSQQLPSIESGIPWTLSSSSQDRLTGKFATGASSIGADRGKAMDATIGKHEKAIRGASSRLQARRGVSWQKPGVLSWGQMLLRTHWPARAHQVHMQSGSRVTA